MPKISVIVPVYNVEKYLKKCLNSLVNQSLSDIEIIVVNDGSPDNSQEIIDSFLENYPNLIQSYIKENRRPRFCQKLWPIIRKRRLYKFCR